MLSIIVALASNNAIGFQNQLLWKISEDLQHFKRITTGHCIIMGRKTYESLGRPLPNRRNIVISRTLTTPPQGFELSDSLPKAITLASLPTSSGEIFVIGGGDLYLQALPLAAKLYVTHIKVPAPQADTFFPKIDWRQWNEVSRQDYKCGAAFPHPFSFVEYTRALMQHNYNIAPFSDMI